MAYTQNELKEMSTEQLIVELIMLSDSMTNVVSQKQRKIVKVLSERKVVDYNIMKDLLEKNYMW